MLRDGEEDVGHLLHRLVSHRSEDDGEVAIGKGFGKRGTQRPCSRRIVRDIEDYLAIMRDEGWRLHLEASRPVGVPNAGFNLLGRDLESEASQLFCGGDS